MPQAQAESKLRQRNGSEQGQGTGTSAETATSANQTATSDTPSSSGITRKLSEARSDPVDKVLKIFIRGEYIKRPILQLTSQAETSARIPHKYNHASSTKIDVL